jgi:hypothetical protein
VCVRESVCECEREEESEGRTKGEVASGRGERKGEEELGGWGQVRGVGGTEVATEVARREPRREVVQAQHIGGMLCKRSI